MMIHQEGCLLDTLCATVDDFNGLPLAILLPDLDLEAGRAATRSTTDGSGAQTIIPPSRSRKSTPARRRSQGAMLERVSRLDATKAHFIDMERRAGSEEAAPESKSAKRRPPFGTSLPNSLARLSRPTEHLGSRGDGRWRGQNSAPRAAAAREPPSRVATPSHREAAQTQATHRCNRCFRMICSCTPTVHKRGRQNNEPAAPTPILMVRSDLDIDWSGSEGSMRCWVKGSVTVDTPEHPSPHVRCEDVTMDTPERPAPDTASPGWNDGRQANVTIDHPRSPGSPGANLSIASPSWSATTTSSPACSVSDSR